MNLRPNLVALFSVGLSLASLFHCPATFGFDDSSFRHSAHVEDRRIKDSASRMKALEQQLEQARRNMIAIGKLGASQGWATKCTGLANEARALAAMGAAAAKAPAVEKVFPEDLGALVSGSFGAKEIDSVDACNGAITTLSNGSKSAVSRLSETNERFHRAYDNLEDEVDQRIIKIYGAMTKDEKNRSCAEVEKKIVLVLLAFDQAYKKLDNELYKSISEIILYAKALKPNQCNTGTASRVPSN